MRLWPRAGSTLSRPQLPMIHSSAGMSTLDQQVRLLFSLGLGRRPPCHQVRRLPLHVIHVRRHVLRVKPPRQRLPALCYIIKSTFFNRKSGFFIRKSRFFNRKSEFFHWKLTGVGLVDGDLAARARAVVQSRFEQIPPVAKQPAILNGNSSVSGANPLSFRGTSTYISLHCFQRKIPKQVGIYIAFILQFAVRGLEHECEPLVEEHRVVVDLSNSSFSAQKQDKKQNKNRTKTASRQHQTHVRRGGPDVRPSIRAMRSLNTSNLSESLPGNQVARSVSCNLAEISSDNNLQGGVSTSCDKCFCATSVSVLSPWCCGATSPPGRTLRAVYCPGGFDFEMQKSSF